MTDVGVDSMAIVSTDWRIVFDRVSTGWDFINLSKSNAVRYKTPEQLFPRTETALENTTQTILPVVTARYW